MDKKITLTELTVYKNRYVETSNEADRINKKCAIFDTITHVEFGFFIGYELYLIFFNKLTTTTWGIYVFVILCIVFTVTFCQILNKAKKLKKEYVGLKDELDTIMEHMKEIRDKSGIRQDGFDHI